MTAIKEELGDEWEYKDDSWHWELYKKGWKGNGIDVYYEVMALGGTDNGVAYTDYKLRFHVGNSKKNSEFKKGFEPVLKQVQQSIQQEIFSLNFSSNDGFENSLKVILDNLLSLAKETCGMIDKYILEYREKQK